MRTTHSCPQCREIEKRQRRNQHNHQTLTYIDGDEVRTYQARVNPDRPMSENYVDGDGAIRSTVTGEVVE